LKGKVQVFMNRKTQKDRIFKMGVGKLEWGCTTPKH